MSEDVRAPFDLQDDAPLRVVFYERNARSTLLFVAHHIAIDLWALLSLLSQLDAALAGALPGPGDAVASLEAYGAFVQDEETYLRSTEAEQDFSYWSAQLKGPLPILELPLARKRPATSDFRGGSVLLQLDPTTTKRLKALADGETASLYAVLARGLFRAFCIV